GRLPPLLSRLLAGSLSRLPVGCLTPPADGDQVGVRGVPLAGRSLRVLLLAPHLGWLNLCLAAGPLALPQCPPRVSGAEQVVLRVQLQEGADDLLRPRPQGDDALVTAPARLVLLGPVQPDRAGHVDVASTHDTRLAWPHAGQALKPDHRPHGWQAARQDGVDVWFGDRLDGFRLAGGRASLRQPADSLEALQSRDGHHLVLDAPLERPDDATDALIDHATGQRGL